MTFHHQRAHVTGDARDRFRQGASLGLLMRAGIGGERNEFTSFSMRELAYHSLMAAGITPGPDVAAQALGLTMEGGGMHSTSDFVSILANTANKSMLKGYEEVDETFEQWTATGSLPDFRPQTRVDMGLFPSLTRVEEGAEYKYATMSDRAETIVLATYGRLFSITRQAVVNDDMSLITRTPRRMGRAARRTIGDLVYAILIDNPDMSDGNPLFDDTTHANVATGAAQGPVSVATLDAARSRMALQRDPDDHAVALGIRPRFLLCPVAQEGAARVVVTSEFDHSIDDASGTVAFNRPNRVRNIATVVSEARLDASATPNAWYLAGDPNTHDTIEVAYLNGIKTPMLEQRPGWHVDGVEFKVRMDAGVKAMGHRALFRNSGVAPE